MVAIPACHFTSPEAYLAGEEQSQIKHEYIDGQVYAMSGGSDAHNTIMLNLASALKTHLRGGQCRVFAADMKAQIQLSRYYYPDVMVTCDNRDRQITHYKSHPYLIVEVLSDSTEAFDRGDKFADYQQIETLQEYVLISQKRQRVDCFRRNLEGLWVLHPHNANDNVCLASIDFHININALYEDVTFIDQTNPAS